LDKENSCSSNEWPSLLGREDNNKNAHIKVLFSRTTKPEKFKFKRRLSDKVQIPVC
jgi:hypothetical protein